MAHRVRGKRAETRGQLEYSSQNPEEKVQESLALNLWRLRRLSVSPFHRACPPSASPSGEAAGRPAVPSNGGCPLSAAG